MITAKVIADSFGLYSATYDGRIISNRTGQEIYGSIDNSGYRRVCLSIGKFQYTKKVHRLIAETFINNPDDKPQVNHIDGDKSNNHVDNLEWSTPSENVSHAYQVLGKKSSGGHQGKFGILHHQSIPVISIDIEGNEEIFNSMKDAERGLVGVSSKKVSEVCLGKRKTHKGYRWRYA